jgi:hypothetical protein
MSGCRSAFQRSVVAGPLPGQAIQPISAFRRFTPPPPRPSRRRHLTCFLPYRAPSPTGSSRRHSIAPSVQSIALRPLPYLLDLRARALDRPAPVGHLPPTKGARWPPPAVAFAAEQHVPLTAMMLPARPARAQTDAPRCPAALYVRPSLSRGHGPWYGLAVPRRTVHFPALASTPLPPFCRCSTLLRTPARALLRRHCLVNISRLGCGWFLTRWCCV